MIPRHQLSLELNLKADRPRYDAVNVDCHLYSAKEAKGIQVERLQKYLTLILWRSPTGTIWFYTSTNNKRAARPKLYTKSLTRDLKRMYSRLTLVRISIKL